MLSVSAKLKIETGIVGKSGETARPASDLIECRRLPSSHESVGKVMEFIAGTELFGSMRSKTLFLALTGHIEKGHHVAAFRNHELVGYCGWLTTTEEICRKWLEGAGRLKGVPSAHSDAVVLSIVRLTDGRARLPIIRSCRQLNLGRRVYFRRDGRGGHDSRKSSVFNGARTGRAKGTAGITERSL